MLTKEDLGGIGEVINKRFETFEMKIEGKIHAAKEALKGEITASEERLRSEILAARTEAKADNLRILGKMDKKNSGLENLEKATGTPNPHKN
jgi:cell division septum initiation protein DivIVA